MGVEIERRFLASPQVLPLCGGQGRSIVQGYLWVGSGGNARIRLEGERAVLTCKGPKTGCARRETEIPIPPEDAAGLLAAMPPQTLIRKTRHSLKVGGMEWCVDVFGGRHRGLIIAEIELDHPAQVFLRPDWVLREITWDARYGNSSLALSRDLPGAAA